MGDTHTYEIQVEGHIGERWLQWFEDMAVRTQPDKPGDGQRPTTTLTGTVTDQAALLGLLQKLYTLGLPLLLVQRQADASTERQEGSDRR